ncbi:DUF1304 domain-containing protein [uncultured Actinomyces sp.]|uniref:DUF1304 domain-containing protein n=1 Tax=uncultured Actinomyces sp. TaxID=249061 RepID=UPI0028E7BFA4|nr:DUF1304 domain-containing protein [uncultured Actinomyces sp.]
MMIIAMAFAILSALLHVFIFSMESISWTSERTRATFNMSEEAAKNTKEMAFNQGFYNLFLALEVFVGVLVYMFASPAVGLALMLFGTGSMLAAALLLFVTSPDKRSAAIKQGTLPVIAVIALILTMMIY